MIARHFELKGRRAEEFIFALATKTFLTDWCYLNPRLPNGKELCDLLVIFDDIAIIWQVKDLKLDNGHYSKGEVEKNLRQLAGARRSLFELKTSVVLKNPRRGDEAFYPDTINHIFLISALLGEREGNYSLFEHAKAHLVHVFTREFTEIALSELDTISDFTEYLFQKENILAWSDQGKNLIIAGGEEELLAVYLQNNREFPVMDKALKYAIVEKGQWDSLRLRQEYVERKRLDAISYAWDDIIEDAHLSKNAEYERVARELARPNRFQRRVISIAMVDARMASEGVEGSIFYRAMTVADVTYCFLFVDGQLLHDRLELLQQICLVERGTAKQNAG